MVVVVFVLVVVGSVVAAVVGGGVAVAASTHDVVKSLVSAFSRSRLPMFSVCLASVCLVLCLSCVHLLSSDRVLSICFYVLSS